MKLTEKIKNALSDGKEKAILAEIEAIRPRPVLIAAVNGEYHYPKPADSEAGREFVERLSRLPFKVTLRGEGEKTGRAFEDFALVCEEASFAPCDAAVTDKGEIVVFTRPGKRKAALVARFANDTAESLEAAFGGEAEAKFFVEWTE